VDPEDASVTCGKDATEGNPLESSIVCYIGVSIVDNMYNSRVDVKLLLLALLPSKR
jgi:hypothetical protein